MQNLLRTQKPADRWLLLIHQIPPKPAYLRVKVGRRLQRIGAVAIKNTVYVLPAGEQTLEDFQWTVREITEGGGEATVCEASFIEGRSDAQVEELFREARAPDYEEIAEQARSLLEEAAAAAQDADARRRLEHELPRLEKRLADILSIDFFGAPGSETASAVVEQLRERLKERANSSALARSPSVADAYRSRTWVTRRGVHVDRMASAWLIRRFIDPEARFKYVPSRGYEPEPGELRFDMFDAEFTHEGDRCTFEVLLDRTGLEDAALCAISEVVHDVDLKDAKFGRREADGITVVVAAIAMAHGSDEERVARGAALFEDLYIYYQRKRR